MPERKIKAVLFDLGETLLNFGQVKTTPLFKQGARLSYDFLKSCGQPVERFTLYCWRNLVHLRIRCWLANIRKRDFDALALFKKAGAKRRIEFDEEQWLHFSWLWYEPLYEMCKREPKIKETLTALKNMGLKLGIVSNTFVHASSLEKHLEDFGILDYFPVRLYSYQFNFRKPDGRIFRIAAERIGESMENIMFVGDRIDQDIEGAEKIGMLAVLKHAHTNAGKQPPEGTPEIDRIAELPALIERINKTDTKSAPGRRSSTNITADQL